MRPRAALAWLRTPVRVLALLLLIVMLGGCGVIAPMLPPTPHSSAAKDVWNLYAVVFAMAFAVFLGVEGFIVYAIFRYRRRDDRLPTQMHGNALIEVVWTAIPTAIVLVLFVLSIFTLRTVNATTKPDLTIQVIGFQWQWTFNYLDDAGNVDYSVTGTPGNDPTMVVPVNEPVKLILHSDDVIHSFYVPAFLIKRDVIPMSDPANDNTLELNVSDLGTYAGQCAEFCGTLHAQMRFSVQGVTASDFDTWLANAKAGVTPAPSVQPTGQVLDLSAENIAFSTQELTAPANESFTIHFTNNDSVIHNVAIVKGDTPIFHGEGITGPNASTDYVIPALDPGDYTFVCDYHSTVPAMIGTLTVK